MPTPEEIEAMQARLAGAPAPGVPVDPLSKGQLLQAALMAENQDKARAQLMAAPSGSHASAPTGPMPVPAGDIPSISAQQPGYKGRDWAALSNMKPVPKGADEAVAQANSAVEAYGKPQPQASPVYSVPSHWDYSRDPVSYGTRVYQDQAMQKQAAADIEGINARKEAVTRTAESLKELSSAQDAARADFLAHEYDRKKRVEDQMAKSQKFSDDAASMKVDPQRFFTQMGAGQKVAMIIAAGLSGFQAGMNRQQSNFIGQLQSFAQQDIDAQNANIANAGHRADRQRGILHDLKDQLGDERLAEATYTDMVYANVQTKLQQMLQDPANHAYDAQIKGRLADLDAARSQLMVQRDQMAFVAAHAVGGGGAGPNPKHGASKELIVTLPDGSAFEARRPEEAADIRSKIAGVKTVKDRIKQMMTMRDEYQHLTPSGRARLQSLHELVSDDLRTMGKGGTLDDGMVQHNLRMLGDPTAITEATNQKLDTVYKELDKSVANTIRAQGAEQVDKTYKQNSDGSLTPVSPYRGEQKNPSAGSSRFKPAGGQ